MCIGVLTFNGRILNESGHMRVALTLLRELGVSHSPLHHDTGRNLILKVSMCVCIILVLFSNIVNIIAYKYMYVCGTQILL